MNMRHQDAHQEVDETLTENVATGLNGKNGGSRIPRTISSIGRKQPIAFSPLEDSDDLFPLGGDPIVKGLKPRIAATNGTFAPTFKPAHTPASNGHLQLVSKTVKKENELPKPVDPANVADICLKGDRQPWNAALTGLEDEIKVPSEERKVYPLEPSVETDPLAGHEPSPYRSVWLELPKGIPVFPFDGSEPRVAEQYRILRTSILLHAAKPKVVAISSGSSGDGKTLTAVNFAGIMAMKSDTNVLIVEGDLRKCSIAPLLGIQSSPGLAEVLRGQATLEQAIVRAEQLPNFHVLPGGNVAGNPAELLDSDVFRSFVLEVRKRFTFIVFDTTPVASVADFKLVMQVSDGVLMVVRPDHTDRDSFHRAFEIVPEKRLLGVVINAFEDWFLWNKLDANYYYSGEPRKPKSQPFFRWRRRPT